MKISNKAIVGSIGCIIVGLATLWLKNANCLWALCLVYMLTEEINY